MEFHFSAAAFTAKHIHDANILPVLRQAFECLHNLEEEGLINYTLMTLQYIVEAGGVPDKKAFAETVRKAIPGLDKERLMRTMAEQWKEEGRTEGEAKGRQEGEAEGIQKGLKEAALRLLD